MFQGTNRLGAVDRKNDGKQRTELCIFGPDLTVVLVDDHSRNRQAKAAAGAIAAAGIRGVLLEDVVEVLRRDGVPGIANVDALGVGFLPIVEAPFRGRRKCGPGFAALPKERVPAYFNNARLRSKFTGIVQYIDEHLFNLPGFEEKGEFGWRQVSGDRDRFIVGERGDFM